MELILLLGLRISGLKGTSGVCVCVLPRRRTARPLALEGDDALRAPPPQWLQRWLRGLCSSELASWRMRQEHQSAPEVGVGGGLGWGGVVAGGLGWEVEWFGGEWGYLPTISREST